MDHDEAAPTMDHEAREQLIRVAKWALVSSLTFVLIAISGSFSSAHGGIGVLVMSFLPLFVMMPIVMVPSSLLFMLWRRTRRGGVQMFVLGVAWLVSGAASIWLEYPIRRHVFHQVAHESTPLVDALHAYQRNTGAPATELQDLVPDYLPKIPKTGLDTFSEFGYSADPDAQSWELNISVSSGILNWDQFMYWSSEEYPYYYRGGRIERFGRWAYLHE